MILILGRCPLCREEKGLGKAFWIFPKSGRRYEMPILICFECGSILRNAKEEEIGKLIDLIHMDLLIHDLEKEANTHDA